MGDFNDHFDDTRIRGTGTAKPRDFTDSYYWPVELVSNCPTVMVYNKDKTTRKRNTVIPHWGEIGLRDF